MIVGIDIGTSYSSIAIQGGDGKAKPVIVANGAYAFGDKASLPSAIFVEEDGDILIGQLAMTSRMKNPSNFLAEFKRDLGLDVPMILGPLQLLPQDIYTEYFRYLIQCAQKTSGETISQARICYPANYTRKKIELIQQAAQRAGLLNVELIDEPTAAAYCYYAEDKIQAGDKLLVYDFGGGTFDVALIQCQNQGFTAMSPSLGLERCGGSDIDRLIFQDIKNAIPTDLLQSISSNERYEKQLYAQIAEKSIRIKHELSSAQKVREVITVGWDTIPYELNQDSFNKMINPLVEETLVQVRQILKNAQLKPGEIARVLVVGGTSRIPYIEEKLREATGRPVSYDIDPELAVCSGAALWKPQQAPPHPGRPQLRLVTPGDPPDTSQAKPFSPPDPSGILEQLDLLINNETPPVSSMKDPGPASSSGEEEILAQLKHLLNLK